MRCVVGDSDERDPIQIERAATSEPDRRRRRGGSNYYPRGSTVVEHTVFPGLTRKTRTVHYRCRVWGGGRGKTVCARVRRKYNARYSRRLLGPMNRGGRPRVWRAQSVKCNYAADAVCFMLLAAYTAGKYHANGVGGVKQKSHTCRRRLFPSPLHHSVGHVWFAAQEILVTPPPPIITDYMRKCFIYTASSAQHRATIAD